MTVSALVGEGIRTAWAVSMRGIQIVNGSMFVLPDETVSPTSKNAWVLPGRLAVLPFDLELMAP